MWERLTWQAGLRKGGGRMYGYVCERCGAYLDPGERCDCIEDEEKAAEPKKTGGSEKKKRTSRKKVAALCKA